MRTLIFLSVFCLTACQSSNEKQDEQVYKSDCTNGQQTINFDVDGQDYEGNIMNRQQSIDMLADALTDDESYEGVWTCE